MPPAAPTTTITQPTLSAMARRPACAAAAVLIAGILAHPMLPDVPQAWLALAAAGAIAAVGGVRWPFLSTGCLAGALVMLGVAVGQLGRFHFAADDIVAFTSDAPRLAEVELVIDQPPRVLSQDASAGRPIPPRQVTRGRVTRVKTWQGWVEASGELLVQVSPPNAGLAYGQTVIAHGHLGRPAPALNPGQFDWQRYYREQRILATIDVDHGENVRVVTEGSFSILNWLREGARAALERGFTKSQSVDHALLRALLLGDSDPQLRDIQADFQRTGTSHHLSISGMHVAVLGMVVFFVCRLMRLSPRKSAFVMMGFVVLYGLVALPAPPVVRSIVLCLCAGVGIVLRRHVDGIQLLALTVFVMLVVHPLDLYNAGFQLSFLTVLGLMVYAHRAMRRLEKRDEDERVLWSFGIGPTRTQRIRNWARHWALEAFATGLVAWAVSAPLIVSHFDQLNPWAVPFGIVLAIPVFASMIGGLLKVVLTLVLPWFAPLWAWLAAWPVEAMRGTAAWLAKLPGSDVPMPGLPILVILAYYALLALPLIPIVRPRIRLAFRGGAAAAFASFVLLPLIVMVAPRGGGGGPRLMVTLLSVGAGQCAVVQTPSGKTILIDAGSTTFTDLQRTCVEPFLRRTGVSRLDAIYVSHANADHFSAVAAAVERYAPREVVVTPQFRRHAVKNHAAGAMLKRLEALKCPVNTAAAGRTVDLGDGCALELLWPPPADEKLDENDSCQVMRLTYAGKTILFTGDIQVPAQRALLGDAAKLAADVLIAPHHGSAEETTPRFVEAVGAPTILASNDRTPSGKQREFDKLVKERTLLRTDRCGAITVTIDKEGTVRVETFLPR